MCGKENQPDGPAKLNAKRTGNDVVVPAPLYAQIGGDGRERYAGEDLDDIREKDDKQRLAQTDVPDHVASAAKENDAENGEDTGREYASKSP